MFNPKNKEKTDMGYENYQVQIQQLWKNGMDQ